MTVCVSVRVCVCVTQIVYEDTSAELTGNQLLAQLPKFDLPQLPEALKPPKNFR